MLRVEAETRKGVLMEFSIIELIFAECVPVQVIAMMLRIAMQYPLPVTFTEAKFIVKCVNMNRHTITVKFENTYRKEVFDAVFDCIKKKLSVTDSLSGIELSVIPVDMAKFLYYKLAYCIKGMDMLVYNGRKCLCTSSTKLPDYLVPDRLMRVILDNISPATELIPAAEEYSINLVRPIMDDENGYMFIEVSDKEKKMNVYNYTPTTTYYQSPYNSNVGYSNRENCTYINVAVKIANMWRDYLKSTEVEIKR